MLIEEIENNIKIQAIKKLKREEDSNTETWLLMNSDAELGNNVF